MPNITVNSTIVLSLINHLLNDTDIVDLHRKLQPCTNNSSSSTDDSQPLWIRSPGFIVMFCAVSGFWLSVAYCLCCKKKASDRPSPQLPMSFLNGFGLPSDPLVELRNPINSTSDSTVFSPTTV